jgi:hypothetical protein
MIDVAYKEDMGGCFFSGFYKGLSEVRGDIFIIRNEEYPQVEFLGFSNDIIKVDVGIVRGT